MKRTIILLCTLLFAISVSANAETLLVGSPISSGEKDANKAFDGDPATYYGNWDDSYGWVGLDLGRPYVISHVAWMARDGYQDRVKLGIFEGANSPDFMDAVPLHIIPEEGVQGEMHSAEVDVSRGFRYVRYVGPSMSRCYIAELAFYGTPGSGDDSKFYQLGNIPTVNIHIEDGAEPKDRETELNSVVSIVYDNGTRIQEHPMTIRGRGNASWEQSEKKPYRIKFRDGAHHMLKDSHLESPAKAKKWTLLNSYGDKTMMRNILSYEISRRMEMPYTVYCVPVDVILNGEYKGCYQLADQITIDKDRVDISAIEPGDTSGYNLGGGYLIEIDGYAKREPNSFVSNNGIPVTIKFPDESDIVPAQYNYIKDCFNQLESDVWKVDFNEPIDGFRRRLDLLTYLKHFLVGEFCGCVDLYWSQYFYKDRGSEKLVSSPSWDFDVSFDNDRRVYPVNEMDNWISLARETMQSAGTSKKMVKRILTDPDTEKELKDLWHVTRDRGLMDVDVLISYIDSLERVLSPSAALNFSRWPILDKMVQMNPYALGNYPDEVNVLRTYVTDRVSWVDRKLAYSSADTLSCSSIEISTAQQFLEFAKIVNEGNTSLSASLTCDIDMQGVAWIPIGSEALPYVGTFDGRGHAIRNLSIEGLDRLGLFGVLSGGACVFNVTLDKSCSIKGRNYVGLIGATFGPGLVRLEHISNEASVAGSKNVAGILGSNRQSQAIVVIRHCFNTADISGTTESAAISGWVGGYYNVHDCWNSGKVSGYEEGKDLFRYGGKTDDFHSNYSTMGTQATLISEEDVMNGNLCWMLNKESVNAPVWYQKIGEDAHPTFDYNRGVVWKEESGQFSNRNYLLGDVNCDGAIDEKDIELTANYVLGRTADLDMINVDPNRDGRVDVLEMIQMLRLKDGKEILPATNITARLSTEGVSLGLNESVKVPLMLYASEPVSVLQADIVVPKGLTLDEAETARGAMLESGHRMEFATIDDGYRIVVYSPDLAELTATSGVLVSMVWKSDDTFNGGKIKLKNQVLGTKANGQCRPSDAKSEIALVPTLVAELLAQQTSYELELGQNETANLNITVLPETATDKSLSYKSSAPAIVDVNKNGFIRAYEEGSSVITITAKDGSNVSTSVTVTVLPDSSSLDEVNDPTGCATIYDTNGIRITQMRRGRIYIVGGKRIMIQ